MTKPICKIQKEIMEIKYNLADGVILNTPREVNFFWQGKSIENGTLYIYSASGNLVRKINISDKSTGKSDRREVGSWDLKDSRGRTVSEGTYVVKSTIKGKDGKKEKISLVFGVR